MLLFFLSVCWILEIFFFILWQGQYFVLINIGTWTKSFVEHHYFLYQRKKLFFITYLFNFSFCCSAYFFNHLGFLTSKGKRSTILLLLLFIFYMVELQKAERPILTITIDILCKYLVSTLNWLPNFPHKTWVDPGEGLFTCQVNCRKWGSSCNRLCISCRRWPPDHYNHNALI